MTTSKQTLSANYTNADVIRQFKCAMIAAGIVPPRKVIADGALHRYKINGLKNGGYVLRLGERPAGHFHDLLLGVSQRWEMPLKMPENVILLSAYRKEAYEIKRIGGVDNG